MASLMKWDELNVMERSFHANIGDLRRNKQRMIDSIMEFLIICYLDGCRQANEELHTNVEPDTGDMYAAVDRTVDGEDFVKRIEKYCDAEDIDGIERVVETESHFCYNAGAFDTARRTGKTVRKRWRTLEDDKVRDTHSYMNGQEAGLEDYFYSGGGNMTQFPGQFGVPEEDINCRCYIEYVEM